MTKTIIAFSGRKGVGKTTAAKYLADNHGFKVVSFAGRLKEMATEIFPFESYHFAVANKEQKFEGYDWTPREFLMRFGQFVRYFDKDYWIKGLDLTGSRLAIDDMRFLNEAEYLKEKGATLVRINRYWSQNPYPRDDKEDSEIQLDDYKGFDYSIAEVENTSLGALRSSLKNIMKDMGVE